MSTSNKFTIVTQDNCSYCDKAKAHLDSYGDEWVEFKLDTPDKIATFKALGFKTVPQIISPHGELIGGYDCLVGSI